MYDYFLKKYKLIVVQRLVVPSFKKVGTGQQKAGKVYGTRKKQLEEHIATTYLHLQRFSNVIWYKKHKKNCISKL